MSHETREGDNPKPEDQENEIENQEINIVDDEDQDQENDPGPNEDPNINEEDEEMIIIADIVEDLLVNDPQPLTFQELEFDLRILQTRQSICETWIIFFAARQRDLAAQRRRVHVDTARRMLFTFDGRASSSGCFKEKGRGPGNWVRQQKIEEEKEVRLGAIALAIEVNYRQIALLGEQITDLGLQVTRLSAQIEERFGSSL